MLVLVIEDDADLRHLFAEALADAGHEVSTAPDGAKGWDELLGAESLPDVILLDLMMPNMDGNAFRVRQLADARFASIPTVVATAFPVSASARKALGNAPIIRKPVKLGLLLATVEQAAEPQACRTKHCGCGHRYDMNAWQMLTKLGEMDNGRNAGERLELRDCRACGSTLAWELGFHAISLKLRVLEP